MDFNDFLLVASKLKKDVADAHKSSEAYRKEVKEIPAIVDGRRQREELEQLSKELTATIKAQHVKGEDGRDGLDGAVGPMGPEGKQGQAGRDGTGPQGRTGSAGVDGKDGKDGKDGVNGERGAAGSNGTDGRDGDDGLGVVDADIDFDNRFTFSMSDGSEIVTSNGLNLEDAIKAYGRGPSGPQGPKGEIGGSDPQTAINTAAIANNEADIITVTGQTLVNTTAIGTLTGAVTQNQTDISNNDTDIATLTGAVTQNQTDINTLGSNLNLVSTELSNAEADIVTNTTAIGVNAAAIALNTAKVSYTDLLPLDNTWTGENTFTQGTTGFGVILGEEINTGIPATSDGVIGMVGDNLLVGTTAGGGEVVFPTPVTALQELTVVGLTTLEGGLEGAGYKNTAITSNGSGAAAPTAAIINDTTQTITGAGDATFGQVLPELVKDTGTYNLNRPNAFGIGALFSAQPTINISGAPAFGTLCGPYSTVKSNVTFDKTTTSAVDFTGWPLDVFSTYNNTGGTGAFNVDDFGLNYRVTLNNAVSGGLICAALAAVPTLAGTATIEDSVGFIAVPRTHGSLSNVGFAYSPVANLPSDGTEYSFYGQTGQAYFGGNVGIGTDSPAARLDVTGASNTLQARFGGLAGRGLEISTLLKNGVTDSGILFDAPVTNSAYTFRSNGSDLMELAANGNVGIGTTTPSTLLDLGTVVQASPYDCTLSLRSGLTGWGLGVSAGQLNYNTQTASHVFNVSSSEKMRIDTAGRLLVGTTTAAIDSAGHYLYPDGTYYTRKDNGGVNTAIHVFHNGSLTPAGSITCTGTTVAYLTSSDVRRKENIQDAADPFAKLNSIRVREFDWKADGSHQDYGFIAQELAEVAPEAVGHTEDDTWGVDASKLVPMLVKAVQELTARVEALEAK